MPLCWTWLLTTQQDLETAHTSGIFSLWLLNQLCSQASSDLELKRPELPGGHALHFQIGFSALQTHGAQAIRGLKDQLKNCISSPTEFAGPRCQFTPWTFTTINAPLALKIITPSASPRADQPDLQKTHLQPGPSESVSANLSAVNKSWTCPTGS